MTRKIIGRVKEKKILETVFQKSEAVFMVVYGRRRVGKTYLIEEFYRNKHCIFFSVTGIKDGSRKKQLAQFQNKLSHCFYSNLPLKELQDWNEAFDLLTQVILKQRKNRKMVLFLDELPWLATKKSGFMQALDYFWNTIWSKTTNLKLIVCGSAASWMLSNLVYAKGGLHNRLTHSLLLKPFSLQETRQYLYSKGFKKGFREILNLYLALGGIPHYLNHIDPKLSATQNINALCFTSSGSLFVEFDKLFRSLFEQYEQHDMLIKYIARFPRGVSREEIISMLPPFKSGGKMLTDRLVELETAGFISCFTSYERRNWGSFYVVSDEYVLFYLSWIFPIKGRLKHASHHIHYWENALNSPQYHSWIGLAFESVCYKHLASIISALEIEHLVIGIGRWKFVPSKRSEEKGAEIDLLMERSDNTISVCEIKSSNKSFVINKEYAQNLKNKMVQFKKQTGIKKELQVVFITLNGLTWNKYAKELVCAEVNMRELFECPL